MKIKTQAIEGYEYYAVTFDYNQDSELLDGLIDKAREMSSRVNPHSSGGRYRQEGTRTNKLLGGLLTEAAVIEILRRFANEEGIPLKITESTFIQDLDLAKLGFNQIDLRLLVKGAFVNLEIRSSFSYKTSLQRLFGVPLIDGKGAFSIIGWYSSQNKPCEVKKDYYVFGIHHYDPVEVIDRAQSRVQLYIAGIASKATLESLGFNSSLKQQGATFRIINPIKEAPCPVLGIREILGIDR